MAASVAAEPVDPAARPGEESVAGTIAPARSYLPAARARPDEDRNVGGLWLLAPDQGPQ